MIGFQPYETFQLLSETGDTKRASNLLIAACDAFTRKAKPLQSEIEQFETLASRLFETAQTSATHKAAAILGRSQHLTYLLEQLVIKNIGQDINDYLLSANSISEQSLNQLINEKIIETCATIASRSDLTNATLTKLFQLNSRKVYRSLASNISFRAQGPFLNALARSAQMDHQVAISLADRNDFDAALLAPAFFDLSEADRLKVIFAFSKRKTPNAPIKKTLEQISVANSQLTKALMKLFEQNRRPEITKLLAQITGLEDISCGQISHDESGAALFVVLRAFGCTVHDGLKVLIHATSHDKDRSKILAHFAKLFSEVSIDSMAFLLSVWREEVNLLDLTKPQYTQTSSTQAISKDARLVSNQLPIKKTINTLKKIPTRHVS